jgi:pimeloyl-ACP methyl ester carboxylesterase
MRADFVIWRESGGSGDCTPAPLAPARVPRPAPTRADSGVLHTPGGWRLAQDPGTFAVAGAPFTSLASAAQARVILARGERDPMVSFEELRAHARPAYDIRGAGHNAHVEDPRAVLGLIEVLLRAD